MSHEKMRISREEIEAAKKKHKITPIKPINLENYKPLTFNELKISSPPPIEYVFYPCLQTQGIAFIYAPTGMGKTLFALNMAYAIAGGGNFLKYSCPKPRKVLYVDGEMPFNQIHSRLMQIADKQGPLYFEENLSLLTPDKIFPYCIPKIDEEEGQYIYKELCVFHQYEVIVFDNLSMISSFDENKSHEWKVIQDWLIHMRSLGKTIIIIHHAGKDPKGYRGTSRMLDCADVAISLQPISEEGLEEEKLTAKKFKVVYQKSRLFGGKNALPFEVILENGMWTYRSMEQSDMDNVIERIGLKMTQIAIGKELGFGQSKVAKLVKKARLLGLLRE